MGSIPVPGINISHALWLKLKHEKKKKNNVVTNSAKNLKNDAHEKTSLKINKQQCGEDDRGIGRGDHFLSYKFIKRTIEC